MYSVYIVDDEKLIRDGLKELLDWEALGFRIAGDAGNAPEAMRHIAALSPDLVIADVKMPGMSGLEMIRRLRADGYDGAFIVISGYSEFEYARSAIRYGVNSYLLKPLDERELAGELFALRKSLRNRTKAAPQRAEQALSAEKQWESYLSGFGYQELPESLPEGETRVVMLRFSRNGEPSGLSALYRIAGEEGKNRRIRRLYSSLRDIVFLSMETLEETVALFRRILDSLRSETGVSMIASVGSAAYCGEELPESYKFACDSMGKRFLYGDKGMIARAPAAGICRKIDTEDMCGELIVAIQYQSAERISALLECWKNSFIQLESDEIEIKMAYTSLYTELTSRLSALYKELSVEAFRKQEMIREAYMADTILRLSDILAKYIGGITDALSELLPDSAMEKMISFLDTNYMSPITMESVSQMLHYNTTYFGRKFKQYTGEYFGTYLDKLRIEKAKALIMEGRKIYQVSEMVGFANVDYFNSKFKNMWGCPPPPTGAPMKADGVSDSPKDFLTEINEAVNRCTPLKTRVEISAPGNKAGVLGACEYGRSCAGL